MSSDKSQVFLMKKFSGFYRMQTCTQTITRYAADPAPERRFRLPGSIQTHGIAFAAKAAALCADMAALSHLVENQISRAGSTPKTQDLTPAAAEMACAVQELSFNRAPEICFRLSVRGW